MKLCTNQVLELIDDYYLLRERVLQFFGIVLIKLVCHCPEVSTRTHLNVFASDLANLSKTVAFGSRRH